MSREPKYLDKQEVKRRMAEGLERRRKEGTLIVPPAPASGRPRGGAGFNKKQRKQYVGLCTIAIAALAQRHFDDWYDALFSLSRLMAAANFHKEVYLHTCKQIEHAAVSVNGDTMLYPEATTWLHRRRTRLVSIAGQKPKHAKQEADTNDPVHEAVNYDPPGERPERSDTD